MGERTAYAPGTFCWADLSSTDQEAAKRFYCELFGWEAEDRPVGEGVTYTMMRLRGAYVAAISQQPIQQRDAGVPPTWSSYVSVRSAEESAKRVDQLGGTVHAGPFEVMDAGRMAVLSDPQGAFLMIWEPKGHHGASLVNAPGALVWNELASTDLDGSAAFYSGLFGWQIQPFEGSAEPYLTIKNGEANNGGIRPLQPPGVPPHWLVYFGAEDLDAMQADVTRLGGSLLAGPIDIEMAKIAVIQDPQGAVFALYAGTMEP